jgi:hypothetical protein
MDEDDRIPSRQSSHNQRNTEEKLIIQAECQRGVQEMFDEQPSHHKH